ncbi:MAG: KH domain-containing protein [Oscillatoriales cyanobacterium C42_A2020_001]|nr:KH domain-containing protein [Leptolyngbyaceae cyanobacterium C42_A2020_001]
MAESHSVAATMPSPNYETLIRFLIQPFLESPDALKLDCEVSPNKPRVWVRLAFEGADKGRVFGRGGRNIQAIRTVVEAIAQMSGYSVHLDVYGGPPANQNGEGGYREGSDKSPPRRPPSKRGPSRSTRHPS